MKAMLAAVVTFSALSTSTALASDSEWDPCTEAAEGICKTCGDEHSACLTMKEMTDSAVCEKLLMAYYGIAEDDRNGEITLEEVCAVLQQAVDDPEQLEDGE